jgi:hypothetical protein
MSLASAWCLIKLLFAMWASVLTAIGLIETIKRKQM